MPPRRCSERSRAAREKNDTTTAPLAKLRNDPLPTPAEALLEPFSAFASWFMHIAFPERVVGSACTSSFSRVARRSIALRPAHSRGHQFVARYTEGFSHFVTSMTAPVASGWSESPGGPFTHWNAPPFTAHTLSERSLVWAIQWASVRATARG
jgi:hypothetical protein